MVGIDDAVVPYVPLARQKAQEIRKYAFVLAAIKSRYVFDNNEAWPEVPDEFLELFKQVRSVRGTCFVCPDLAPELAGTAPSKNEIRVVPFYAHAPPEFRSTQRTDIVLDVFRIGNIRYIGLTTLRRVINPRENLNSSLLQPKAHAAGAAKEINGL
jgi:hypothetical protein